MITREQWQSFPETVRQRLMNDPDTLGAAVHQSLVDSGVDLAGWFVGTDRSRAVHDTTVEARDFIRDRAHERDG